jgi:molybdopterin-binding protein
VTLDGVMAEVTIDLGNDQTVIAAITRSSAEGMGLKVGDPVGAVIKAVKVLVGKKSS